MSAAIDPDKLKETAKTIFGALGGAMTSTMIYLGDRMGLYSVLAAGEALTSHELAQRAGLHERWVREWMHQQGAAGILEYEGEARFRLSPEAAAVLADENHPAFGAGFFSSLPQSLAVAEKLPESFRSGVGLPYDAFGPEGAQGIERGLAPFFRTLLVPVALPRVAGLVERLEAGCLVADLGCGGGVALVELAKAYPKSELHGYDISRHALKRAAENQREAGVGNVTFHDASEEPLPGDARFDVVTTFDVLHDMTDPSGAMKAVRAALRDDGIWLVSDIKALPTYEENVAKNPMAAMMYGTSVVTCMSSALSEEGGAGLGTLGLHAEKLEAMAREAGFTGFHALELGHPVNAFYEIRP